MVAVVRVHDRDSGQRRRLGDGPRDAGRRRGGAILLSMMRAIYPHDALGDVYYATLVEALDAKARPRTRPLASSSRTASPGSTRRWACRSSSSREGNQLEVLQGIETTPVLPGRARPHRGGRSTTTSSLWADFGYQGSSFEYGGYILRGFQDAGLDHAAGRRGEPGRRIWVREGRSHGTVSTSTTTGRGRRSARAPAAARSPTSSARRASRSSCSRPASAITIDDFVNDEWDVFAQLAWLDKRTTSGNWRVAKDFPNLPAWICKTVGGTTTHWAGASLRFQDARVQGARPPTATSTAPTCSTGRSRSQDLEPYYAKAEDKMGVTRTNGIPRPAGQQQLQGDVQRRDQALGYKDGQHRPDGDQQPAARRPRLLPADRLLLPGLQVAAPSGRRSTPRSRGAKRPASSI